VPLPLIPLAFATEGRSYQKECHCWSTRASITKKRWWEWGKHWQLEEKFHCRRFNVLLREWVCVVCTGIYPKRAPMSIDFD
jgi:hypothetical protein